MIVAKFGFKKAKFTQKFANFLNFCLLAFFCVNFLGADADKNRLVKGDGLNETFLYLAPYVYGNAKKVQDTTIMKG